MADPEPDRWLLSKSSDGSPWGDGTFMFKRVLSGGDPWFTRCQVTPLIGGFDTMTRMVADLNSAITWAREEHRGSPRPNDGTWPYGHVYIAGLRFNCLRDLSYKTPSGWTYDIDGSVVEDPVAPGEDPTAIGMVLRLMQAHIKVRLMPWLPAAIPGWAASMRSHADDHFNAALIVAAENTRLMKAAAAGTEDLGVVALDMRIAEKVAGAHHQKLVVIRVGDVNCAYVGGVDLAFTRRDTAHYHGYSDYPGDWQSGGRIPAPDYRWPRESKKPGIPSLDYSSVDEVQSKLRDTQQGEDLPASVYGPEPGSTNGQRWHDQHLRLEGPVVQALEEQFRQRWVDAGEAYVYTGDKTLPDSLAGCRLFSQQVITTSESATEEFLLVRGSSSEAPPPVKHRALKPLPQSEASGTETSGAPPYVQVWSTVPVRTVRQRWRTAAENWVASASPGPPRPLDRLSTPLLERGEFTILSGLMKAIRASTQLIWIFDQYFWSAWVARSLRKQLEAQSDLHVIIILPPFPDTQPQRQLSRRRKILKLLLAGTDVKGKPISDRVGVYSLWCERDAAGKDGVGIYAHAKVQIFDGTLLVVGSANLNRKSLTCDTELACAILDPGIVQSHQQALWKYLFGDSPASPMPGTPLESNYGSDFFNAFATAAKNESSLVLADPLNQCETDGIGTPKHDDLLPNGINRREYWADYDGDRFLVLRVFDPLALAWWWGELTADLESVDNRLSAQDGGRYFHRRP